MSVVDCANADGCPFAAVNCKPELAAPRLEQRPHHRGRLPHALATARSQTLDRPPPPPPDPPPISLKPRFTHSAEHPTPNPQHPTQPSEDKSPSTLAGTPSALGHKAKTSHRISLEKSPKKQKTPAIKGAPQLDQRLGNHLRDRPSWRRREEDARAAAAAAAETRRWPARRTGSWGLGILGVSAEMDEANIILVRERERRGLKLEKTPAWRETNRGFGLIREPAVGSASRFAPGLPKSQQEPRPPPPTGRKNSGSGRSPFLVPRGPWAMAHFSFRTKSFASFGFYV